MNYEILNILIKLSDKAYTKDEAPVSAIIVCDGKIVSKAYNTRNKRNFTIDHAEIKAITKANKKLHSWRLNKCTIYSTIEPCDMCKAVIKESRIEKSVYLLPKSELKKQYNKSIFEIYYTDDQIETKIIDNYRKKLELFWKNKR